MQFRSFIPHYFLSTYNLYSNNYIMDITIIGLINNFNFNHFFSHRIEFYFRTCIKYNHKKCLKTFYINKFIQNTFII